MFATDVYVQRRKGLREYLKKGLIFFPGNEESPMNFPDNPYPFRQDSSFLYYWGLDFPGLSAVIDVETDTEIIFGDDTTVAQSIWMGRQPPLAEKCLTTRVSRTEPLRRMEEMSARAARQGRPLHFLPQHRPENILKLRQLCGTLPHAVKTDPSLSLIKGVVAQRSVKTQEEIEQIEAALDTTYKMHSLAMKMTQPGIAEREIVGAMAGAAYADRSARLAFPAIFTVHGEILHNRFHGNVMRSEDMVINDSGAESPLRYASDITRTIPVGGRFTMRQKDIYNIVLSAQEKAIAAVKPGVEFRDIHYMACRELASGLKDLGLMKGDVADAVEAGAHALFFPCGLGHMMGLDVHDMEDLGEDHVGYTKRIVRSPCFGAHALRLAKRLKPGFVVTVEPGLYFIPELIDQWKAQKKYTDFIRYDAVKAYRDFGGVRIEDDILVEKDGCRLLGRPLPKTIQDVEAAVGK